MKIIRLLEGLYEELKLFNSNVECFNLVKTEAKRRREYPMMYMTDIEKISFKRWVKKCLDEKGIVFDENTRVANYISSFFAFDAFNGTRLARNHLSASLGYSSFDDLLDAWRRSREAVPAVSRKAGAA